MKWSEYAAYLPEGRRHRLVLALGAGLRETRLAAQAASDDGDVAELLQHLDTAITRLTEARRVMRT